MSAPVATARQARLVGEQVSHRFGPRRALQPVDFDVSAPGVVAITGANGSGKSTLLRILCGLLRPTAGATKVEVEGVVVPPAGRRRVIGLATPELSFYEEFTAAENLEFAAMTRDLPNMQSAVQDALRAVGLENRSQDLVSAFSSGMKQRLRLAFAVLHRPAVLMLDEPGSHLDDEGRAVVEQLVHGYRAHALVVLATNEPREMDLAERRIELRGRGLGDPS